VRSSRRIEHDTGTDSDREQERPWSDCASPSRSVPAPRTSTRSADEIWPELVDAIKDAGFENYSLFRRGTTITAYVECHPDVATRSGRSTPAPTRTRWSKWFEDVIVSLTDEAGNLYRAEEVTAHLD
jgi:L-rhamnose mutarotase